MVTSLDSSMGFSLSLSEAEEESPKSMKSWRLRRFSPSLSSSTELKSSASSSSSMLPLASKLLKE